jgi:hypothetical protein
MPLTIDEVNDLLANTKTKGAYRQAVEDFIDSDEIAVNPAETWPELFGNKTATAMYQSFNNAIQKMNGAAEQVELRKREDAVYLLHKGRIQLAKESE